MSKDFFYAVAPPRYKEWISKHIDYCDFKTSPTELTTFMAVFSMGIGAAAGIFSFILLGLSVEFSLIAAAIGGVLAQIIMFVAIIMIADSRANFVELILPDALQIVSSNLRSGLTPDKAILTSARPEFGPLEKELKKVSKDTLSGVPFEDSLRGMTRKIKSSILDKTIGLLIEGMAKGGSLTNLLDSVANDIRQARLLRGEIKSYVMMYGIFIFFAAGVGAPVLYSVSTFMVETMTTLGSQVSTATLPSISSVSFFNFQNTSITTEFLMQYSAIAILVTSVFGSLLIGLIQEGSEKAGIKFIPILLGVSLGVFFGSQLVLRSLVSIG